MKLSYEFAIAYDWNNVILLHRYRLKQGYTGLSFCRELLVYRMATLSNRRQQTVPEAANPKLTRQLGLSTFLDPRNPGNLNKFIFVAAW